MILISVLLFGLCLLWMWTVLRRQRGICCLHLQGLSEQTEGVLAYIQSLGPTHPRREGLGSGPVKREIYTRPKPHICINTQFDTEDGSIMHLRNTSHFYTVQGPKRSPPTFICLSLKIGSKPKLNCVQNKSNLLHPRAKQVSLRGNDFHSCSDGSLLEFIPGTGCPQVFHVWT